MVNAGHFRCLDRKVPGDHIKGCGHGQDDLLIFQAQGIVVPGHGVVPGLFYMPQDNR